MKMFSFCRVWYDKQASSNLEKQLQTACGLQGLSSQLEVVKEKLRVLTIGGAVLPETIEGPDPRTLLADYSQP